MPPPEWGSLDTGGCPLLRLDHGLQGAVLALEMMLYPGPFLNKSGLLPRGLIWNVQRRAQGPLTCTPQGLVFSPTHSLLPQQCVSQQGH